MDTWQKLLSFTITRYPRSISISIRPASLGAIGCRKMFCYLSWYVPTDISPIALRSLLPLKFPL